MCLVRGWIGLGWPTGSSGARANYAKACRKEMPASHHCLPLPTLMPSRVMEERKSPQAYISATVPAITQQCPPLRNRAAIMQQCLPLYHCVPTLMPFRLMEGRKSPSNYERNK